MNQKNPGVKRADAREPVTDLGLLSRGANLNDQEAWAQIYEKYQWFVRMKARGSGATPEEEWDVLQAVMLRLTQQLPKHKYDPALGSFRSYLRQEIMWSTTDQFRKRFPGFVKLVDFLLPDSDTATRSGETPEPATLASFPESQERRDATFLLQEARQWVGNKARKSDWEIFEKWKVQGIPPKDIARQSGKSLKAVYHAAERVRKVLAEGFEPMEPPHR